MTDDRDTTGWESLCTERGLLFLTKIIRNETEGKYLTGIELSSIFNFSDWGPKKGRDI